MAVVAGLTSGAELYRAGYARKERVVLAYADVLSSQNQGPALPDDDLADPHLLPIGALYAQILRV